MKALCLKQPWANRIASGEKTIETRTWSTRYRGELLIVASKKPNIPPAGCAVAIAELLDCRPMQKADEQAACCETFLGAVAWVLANVRKVQNFPVRGKLNLFDVELPQGLLDGAPKTQSIAFGDPGKGKDSKMSKTKKKDAKRQAQKGVTQGAPSIEERMKNILVADQFVRTAKRDLKIAKEMLKDKREDLKEAEKARDNLLAEAENGLPLYGGAAADKKQSTNSANSANSTNGKLEIGNGNSNPVVKIITSSGREILLGRGQSPELETGERIVQRIPLDGQAEAESSETDEQKANDLRNTIVRGGKVDALVAISEADLALLCACDAIGLKGDWRRAAVRKRIDELKKADAAA